MESINSREDMPLKSLDGTLKETITIGLLKTPGVPPGENKDLLELLLVNHNCSLMNTLWLQVQMLIMTALKMLKMLPMKKKKLMFPFDTSIHFLF